MLKHYRETAGLTREQLAELIHFSTSHVTSVETGRRNPKNDFISRADRATNAAGALITLADMCLDHAGFMPGFEEWPEFERRATMLRGWESTLVPGLLQLPEYMDAVLEHNQTAIDARLSRQPVLAQENPPEIRYVVDEWVLRHLVGSSEVMYKQLQYLEQAVIDELVIIQVKPSNILPGRGSAFALATVDGRTVGYEESAASVRLVSRDDELHLLEVIYHRLLAEADNPSRSLEQIRKVREELWRS